MRIITVSREFGSGGREIGKRLSDALGIAYYDREIITEIAKESELDESYVERVLNKSIASQYPLTFSRTFAVYPQMNNDVSSLLALQHKTVRRLAKKGDCIIVGRSADFLLKEYKPLRLFVYADMDSKLKRCMERRNTDEKISEKEMIKKIKEIDKSRKTNHDMISDCGWGEKESYDLLINTSGKEIKSLVPAIVEFANAFFKN